MIRILPDGRLHVDLSVTGQNGPTHIKKTFAAGTDQDTAIASLRGSLTPTYGKLADLFEAAHKNLGTKADVFRKCRDFLKFLPCDKTLSLAYIDFISRMNTKSANTRNNYRVEIRRVLRWAWSIGLIDNIPIRNFGFEKRGERHRLPTADELKKLFEKAEEIKSPLYWLFHLLDNGNVARKMDLINLTRDCLQQRPSGWWIKFNAAKTYDVVSRPTYLVEITPEYLEYVEQSKRDYPHCKWLHHRNGRYIGDPKKHWSYLKREAKIFDLTFEDLKHHALTVFVKKLMARGLDVKITLMKLGIQHDEGMIDLYLEYGADEILEAVNE